MTAERAKRLLKLNESRRADAVKQISLILEQARKIIPGVKNDDLECFSIRFPDLGDLYKRFTSLHDDIKESYFDLSQEPPDSESNILIQVQEMYYECLFKSKKCGMTDEPTNASVSRDNDCVNPKLAPIKLPTFSGNYDNFTQWYDLYVSLIHDNTNLSNIHKYHYFVSSLSGQALNLVKSIQFDSAHYQLAFDTLLNHYKNDKLLAMRYLDNIINAKPVKIGDRHSLESFVNLISENVKALTAMEIPNLDQFILFYLASRLVDTNTLHQFEWEHKSVKFPTADMLIEFGLHVDVLRSSQNHDKTLRSKKLSSQNFMSSDSNSNNKSSCVYCSNGHHELVSCQQFKFLSVKDKLDFIKSKRLCFICFSKSHMSKVCSSDCLCKCNRRHNPLLCFQNKKSNTWNRSDNGKGANQNPPDEKSFSSTNNSSVLLGTLIVNVKNKYGHYVKARCLLDSGSTSSFCSKIFFNKLNLPKRVSVNNCVGIGNTQLNISNELSTISISPIGDNSIEFTSDVIITPKICNLLPSSRVPVHIKKQFERLKLSDRSFNEPSQVDILIGANLYPLIISDGPLIRKGSVVALPTVFGYCVTGPIPEGVNKQSECFLSVDSNLDLTKVLTKFWEIENCPSDKTFMKPEDAVAEKQFEDFLFRSPDGKYNSPLLVKPNIVELGGSFNSAKMRFLRLEKSLIKSPDMRREYNAFMAEYRDLGHMKRVNLDSGKFYVPHHPVIKESSTTTKLRVVFDGSATTTSGVSLNSCLYSGPKLNNEICDIILRFRLHRVALVADICKMYRMVNIIPDHRVYQHILFRFNENDPIEEWELTTNTYGLASASYIAHKAILQLNCDEGHRFPLAKNVIPRDLFVNDLCSGASDIDSAKLLVEDIINFLMAGGFKMRKWMSNEPSVLQNIPEDFRESNLNFDKSDSGTKLLGVYWNSVSDSLSFNISPCVSTKIVTKRTVLSVTVKLFDPLGFVSPVIFLLKYFFQTLWKMDYDWDDPVDEEYSRPWVDCVKSLDLLHCIRIPRFCGFNSVGPSDLQLLGFSDASERGYAAVVYLRVGHLDEEGKVSLLMAKSRLAPLKTLTIPRLELLGVHLLKIFCVMCISH